MRSGIVTSGRRLLVVIEPGDEVVSSLAEACRRHGVLQASIVTFSGAFRRARLIAATEPVSDPEPPLAQHVDVAYTEGIGSGTVTAGVDGPAVHLHVALGVKDRAGAAVAGHLVSAECHYVVEVVVDEILAPALERRPHPGSSGIPVLWFEEEQ